jgi:hypothetical protein
MNAQNGNNRRFWSFVGVVTVGVTLTACPPSTRPDPATEVPPESGGFELEPDEVDGPGDETPPTNTEPPVGSPDPIDCNALAYNGGTINCSLELGTPAAFCDSVYANDPANPAPDFALVSACGSCNATYFQPPATYAGTPCEVIEVLPPDPTVLTDETCKTCHAPNGYDGENSIENPHPWNTVQCTQCHGGDGTATNYTYAHVCPPPQIGNRQQQVLDTRAFFLSFTYAGVQFLPDYECSVQGGGTKTVRAIEWLNFVNPGDIRSAKEGMGCGACHGPGAVDPATGEHLIKGGDVTTYVLRSVMGQATGINSGTRHGIGVDNKFAERRGNNANLDYNTMADFGSTGATNPNYNPADRKVGEVGSLIQAEVYTTTAQFYQNNTYTADAVNNSYNVANLNADNYPNGMNNNIAGDLFQEVLNQACTGCHLQSNYNNGRAGDYRSNGCTACHYESTVSGRSSSADVNISVSRYEPANPNNLTPGERSHVRDHRVRNIAKVPGPANPGLTTVVQGIDDANCRVCHSGSDRTVAHYWGFRLDQNQDLTNNNFFPTNNTVIFTLNANLFGENTNFNNRNINQWIQDEIWQEDVVTLIGNQGQDETPDDIHHEKGMGCIDCHSTGATHGRGKIYGRMKLATHEEDVLCETCHGTVTMYPEHNGVNIVDQGGQAISNTYRNNNNEYWLVSKLNGSTHFIPLTRDLVDMTQAGPNGKTYPPGSNKYGQPVFNYTASAAMGVWESSQDLTNGLGPAQPTNANFQMQDGFGHSVGYDQADNTIDGDKGLECYTCHAAWQNNCVGCHLDANYDANANNFFYSQVTGERIQFNFAANFVYQNPVDFMMGINDRGRITPYQGLHRFMSYADLNNNTSNRMSWSDRNGLGNDPQLRNPLRNNQPALQNQPFTPHAMRGAPTPTKIGVRQCSDCHLVNVAASNQWVGSNFANNYAPFTYAWQNIAAAYAAASAVQVPSSRGYGTNFWLFDANGDPVVDTNNAAVYNLDRIVEAVTGVTNTSSNHPLFDPLGMNPDYIQFQDTNAARVARPLTATVLQRLDYIDNVLAGLSDVYMSQITPAADPNATFEYVYSMKDVYGLAF